MTRFEAGMGEWVVERRWWIIAFTLLLVLASASGIRFLTISQDSRAFFSSDNPQLRQLEALEDTYGRSNTVLFALAPRDGDVFTRGTLSVVEGLTGTLWQMPHSRRVDSIANFQHTRALEDDLIIDDLVRDAANLTDADLARIRATVQSDPRLVNSLCSQSGHVTGVRVDLSLPGRSIDEVEEVAQFARGVAANVRRLHPEIDVYLTGSAMADRAFGEASQQDMTTLVPVMFVALVAIVGLALRSWPGTIGTMSVILFSAATGMGLAGWAGLSVNAASANAPTIILTLAVADSVHILVTMYQRLARRVDQREAIVEALRLNLQPVFLTSLTTAIGFLTMNFSEVPPFRDLGNIVAIGVAAAFFYSTIFLPALMAVLPVRVNLESRSAVLLRCQCAGLADFVLDRRRILLPGAAAVAILLSAGIARLEFNDDWIEYFDHSFPVRRATDFVEDNLTGFHHIEYSLESGEQGGISHPEYLVAVERFADWYRQQSMVVHVKALTSTMKQLNQDMHGGDPLEYRLPERRELAAQYLLLYELSLPFGLDLENQIDVDRSATRMTVSLKGANTTALRRVDARAVSWLKANAPESMHTQGSGLAIIWAHISQRNINGMLRASLGALVLISAILLITLRSVRIALVSLVPNLLPATMAFGVWGLAVGQVGLGLSIVAAMTLGIVVDDTVHFTSKYLRARREQGLDPAGAVRHSFHNVGTAMWITTLSLVVGFAVLASSHYNMNADMGTMTAITISLALALDFLLLPALLLKVDRTGGRSGLHRNDLLRSQTDTALRRGAIGGARDGRPTPSR